ncbi:MAG: GNAT family N-acetyltransferase [Hyphomicrobiales bacterium]
MTAPLIETERLVLRGPRPEDLDRCAELLDDYDVAKMLARVSYPYDLETGKAFLAKAAENWADRAQADGLVFCIDHDGRMVGCLGFDKLRKTPQLGYWLGRPFWGRGFMSEAVRAAIGWFFQNTDHALLTSEAMAENPASLKVMEKLGFRAVGEGECFSLARRATVPAIRTELPREDFVKSL